MEQGKRFSVRFPLDLLDTLKQFAKEDARSINAEIIWILRTYAERRKANAQSVQVPPVSK
jgi:hypothetical protein